MTALKMFIKSSHNGKLVYELLKELSGNQLRVQQTQRLSLDASTSSMGLSAEHGLFATKEWWQNIEERRIPVSIYSGIIRRLYVAGQDADEDDGEDFEYRCDDGEVRTASCVANDSADLDLLRSARESTWRMP